MPISQGAGRVSGRSGRRDGVVAEALLDARQQPRRQLVVAALSGDDGAQLGVEVVRLQAVLAAAEVGVDHLAGLVGQLLVEELLQLSQGLVAVTHESLLPDQARLRRLQWASARATRVRLRNRLTA